MCTSRISLDTPVGMADFGQQHVMKIYNTCIVNFHILEYAMRNARINARCTLCVVPCCALDTPMPVMHIAELSWTATAHPAKWASCAQSQAGSGPARPCALDQGGNPRQPRPGCFPFAARAGPSGCANLMSGIRCRVAVACIGLPPACTPKTCHLYNKDSAAFSS